MNGLAMGLMRAATGYNQGRRIADDRATEQARYDQQQQRRDAEDADRRVQMQASMEAMKAAQADRVADRQRQGEMDARTDFEGGYRPAAQFDQFKGEREALGVPDAPTAFTRGGQGMVKALPSLAEQTAQRVAADRAKERAGELAHDETVRKQGQDFQRQQQDRSFGQQSALQDRSFNQQNALAQTRTPQPTNRPPTEGERRASGLLMVAERENDLMSKMKTPGFVQRVAQDIPWGGGRIAMSDNTRQYESSAQAFARSYLYTVSGANAPEGEVNGLAAQILPQPLDGPKQLEAKAARRAQMVEAMREIGGRAAQPKQAPDVRNDAPAYSPNNPFAGRRP